MPHKYCYCVTTYTRASLRYRLPMAWRQAKRCPCIMPLAVVLTQDANELAKRWLAWLTKPTPAAHPHCWLRISSLPAVVLTKDDKELARLTDEAYFGERALINAEPRAASATGALCA